MNDDDYDDAVECWWWWCWMVPQLLLQLPVECESKYSSFWVKMTTMMMMLRDVAVMEWGFDIWWVFVPRRAVAILVVSMVP